MERWGRFTIAPSPGPDDPIFSEDVRISSVVIAKPRRRGTERGDEGVKAPARGDPDVSGRVLPDIEYPGRTPGR
jgi:hypothetical protein